MMKQPASWISTKARTSVMKIANRKKQLFERNRLAYDGRSPIHRERCLHPFTDELCNWARVCISICSASLTLSAPCPVICLYVRVVLQKLYPATAMRMSAYAKLLLAATPPPKNPADAPANVPVRKPMLVPIVAPIGIDKPNVNGAGTKPSVAPTKPPTAVPLAPPREPITTLPPNAEANVMACLRL
mmetsp:Transcript_55633/g.110544  ORF Transcript_55633/g.110544 Transcript_55633/m.110544 type:complete len:187 (-) Transcript_55633:1012-1572(-)